MRFFVGIVLLVLLANVSAKATNVQEGVKVELPADKDVNKPKPDAVPGDKTQLLQIIQGLSVTGATGPTIPELIEAMKNFQAATQSQILSSKPAKGNQPGEEEDKRILGGDPLPLGEHSYNVAVVTVPLSGNTIVCGGALLSTGWALTAAQCVAGSALTVVAADVSSGGVGQVTFGTPFVHPKFVRNFLLNDIALVRMAPTIRLGAFSSTIKLSTESVINMDGVQLRTFGAGLNDNTQDPDATGLPLQFVDMTNVKKSECLSQTASFFVAYPRNTGCLGTAGGTKGFCYNEAGSPVVHIDEAEGTNTLYGLTSLTLGCPSQYPSAYTLVQPYITWIKMTTNLKTLT
ncbi:trypsin I-P1-like [Cloeon dipterum]|uniref:trypsin I-P1-like n=1 Tax=Cloeon dipterum TaxID=197152 RepID=UPI00321FBCFB